MLTFRHSAALISELKAAEKAAKPFLDPLKEREKLLAQCTETFDGTKRDIDDLVGKLDAIANIWQYVRSTLSPIPRPVLMCVRVL